MMKRDLNKALFIFGLVLGLLLGSGYVLAGSVPIAGTVEGRTYSSSGFRYGQTYSVNGTNSNYLKAYTRAYQGVVPTIKDQNNSTCFNCDDALAMMVQYNGSYNTTQHTVQLTSGGQFYTRYTSDPTGFESSTCFNSNCQA